MIMLLIFRQEVGCQKVWFTLLKSQANFLICLGVNVLTYSSVSPYNTTAGFCVCMGVGLQVNCSLLACRPTPVGGHQQHGVF